MNREAMRDCGLRSQVYPKDSDDRSTLECMQELCALRKSGRQMDASSKEDGSCGEGLHSKTAPTSRPLQGFGGVGPGVRAQDQGGTRGPGHGLGAAKAQKIKEKVTS